MGATRVVSEEDWRRRLTAFGGPSAWRAEWGRAPSPLIPGSVGTHLSARRARRLKAARFLQAFDREFVRAQECWLRKVAPRARGAGGMTWEERLPFIRLRHARYLRRYRQLLRAARAAEPHPTGGE